MDKTIELVNSIKDIQIKSNENYDSNFLILSEINYINNSFIIHNPIHSLHILAVGPLKSFIT